MRVDQITVGPLPQFPRCRGIRFGLWLLVPCPARKPERRK